MDERSTNALKPYRDKRSFDITPEPAGGGSANEKARAFVIQKHWASRLHYDFRLEVAGTMKSWAVPKGPSFDPVDKRMAVHVEDHPISYNTFEGSIPAGQYGAGKVIIWDKGTWIPLEDPGKGLREGKLKFELRGHKMRGHWALVQMKGRGNGKQDPWLLIKEKDGHARPASEFSVVDEMPDSVKHHADKPVASVPAAPAPQVAPSGPPAGARKAALPRALQPQLATLVDTPPRDDGAWIYEIKFDGYRMLARVEGGGVALFTRNGNDWTGRMPKLVEALASMDLPDGWYDGEIIMPGERVPADFQALQGAFDSARTGDIVYYLFDLPYCAGHDLRDVPLVERRAVLQRIVERKPHDRVRFSAVFDAKPADVVASACRLGLEGVIAKRKDSAYVPRRSSDWIKLKCGLREDKPASAIVREKARHRAPVDKKAKAGKAGAGAAARKEAPPSRIAAASDDAQAASILPPSLRVSNPDRVIDTASGTRKIDLVRYYALVGTLMMEHLNGRPVSLVRAPKGIAGELFFQKHAERYTMPGIAQLDAVLFPGHPPMLEVASPLGLLSAAQMNVVEYHTWNGVKGAIGKPDRMTFDLDPGEGVQWRQVVEATQLVHGFLEELGLASFLKTSGGKGLHVVVPLRRQFDWDTVKDFSKAIVEHLSRTIPQRFVAKSGGSNRVGKIFIDYLRNGYGATTVAAWSARARPGLGISVPVRWDELAGLQGGAHWTVGTVHTRLNEG
ncbi:MAG: non-homologous end-joining DNA ligase, partial [Ramlibacter sp.]